MMLFATSHLSIVETTSDLDTNTFGACVDSVLCGHLGYLAEVDTTFELTSDILGDEFR